MAEETRLKKLSAELKKMQERVELFELSSEQRMARIESFMEMMLTTSNIRMERLEKSIENLAITMEASSRQPDKHQPLAIASSKSTEMVAAPLLESPVFPFSVRTTQFTLPSSSKMPFISEDLEDVSAEIEEVVPCVETRRPVPPVPLAISIKAANSEVVAVLQQSSNQPVTIQVPFLLEWVTSNFHQLRLAPIPMEEQTLPILLTSLQPPTRTISAYYFTTHFIYFQSDSLTVKTLADQISGGLMVFVNGAANRTKTMLLDDYTSTLPSTDKCEIEPAFLLIPPTSSLYHGVSSSATSTGKLFDIPHVPVADDEDILSGLIINLPFTLGLVHVPRWLLFGLTIHLIFDPGPTIAIYQYIPYSRDNAHDKLLLRFILKFTKGNSHMMSICGFYIAHIFTAPIIDVRSCGSEYAKESTLYNCLILDMHTTCLLKGVPHYTLIASFHSLQYGSLAFGEFYASIVFDQEGRDALAIEELASNFGFNISIPTLNMFLCIIWSKHRWMTLYLWSCTCSLLHNLSLRILQIGLTKGLHLEPILLAMVARVLLNSCRPEKCAARYINKSHDHIASQYHSTALSQVRPWGQGPFSWGGVCHERWGKRRRAK